MGTVESARFQSVSQDSVAQEERPNEIKDSYEEDQQLSSAGVAKARVEIPGPQEGFDRDAYSRVVTSSQPSQASQITQIPLSSQSQNLSSSQLQTSAPRHRYSSLIWDEDIEGITLDSQEPGSSSYKPSTTQVSRTVSTSPESAGIHTGADLEVGGVENTQVASSGEAGASSSVDSASAEPFFTQASYTDKGVLSSSVYTDSSEESSPDQITASTQDLRDSQAQEIGPLNGTAQLADTSLQSIAKRLPLSALRTSSESAPHPGDTPVLDQGHQELEQSAGLVNTTESSPNSFLQPGGEHPSPLNLSPSSRLPDTRPEREIVQPKSPSPLNDTPSSLLHLPTLQESLQREDSSTQQDATNLPWPLLSQTLALEFLESSSVAFGTQVSFQSGEDEDNHLISSSPYIRSPSVRSSSVPLPDLPLVEK